MKFRHSSVVDPSTYETEGLCDGIHVRMSNFQELEDRGAIRSHQDWNDLVAPCSEYRGTLGPRFNFISVTIPECLPDRLEILSYANDFAFLHDDHIEDKDFAKSEAENNDMMTAFLEAAQGAGTNQPSSGAGKAGKKEMQSRIFLEMLDIDPECARMTMKAWARFVEVGSSRQHNTRFTSLDKYIPYRIMDVGEMFWYGLVTFGLGLHIPEHEMELCRKLTAPSWIAVGLQNDLWSWPKERDAAVQLGQSHVINALWVIMQEHQVDVDGAEAICRQLIKENVAESLKIWEENQFNDSISIDLRKYIECMLFSISGNVVWSLGCPRYNPGSNFNEKQLDWMRNGLPDMENLARTHSRDSSACTIETQESSENKANSELTSPLEGSVNDGSMDMEQDINCRHLGLSISLQMQQEKYLVEAPYDYIAAMPSKGVRDKFIDGLNKWLGIAPEILDQIKEVISILHNASLILDDFQDGSPKRRGLPSAHLVFGPAQAINSASYAIVNAIDKTMEFADPKVAQSVTKRIMILFQGQSMDLFWTYNGHCPELDHYYRMVNQKTGQLFTIATDLMMAAAHRSSPAEYAALEEFTAALGCHFQVRDDYMNLVSGEYASQKGFCEDLDEGKYSVPLIYVLKTQPQNYQLLHLLATGRKQGNMTQEQKKLVLEILEQGGGFKFTRSVLEDLHMKVEKKLARLQALFGSGNSEIAVLVKLLKV